ncbi:MAG: T9SS type A sorting domain-containing protein [candidate division KSB1 bacterium]|nr:T9SS type A sorting domain-containing protein [candidate division KSB1 bacterium]
MKKTPLLITLLLFSSLAAQPRLGKWYCIEALYQGAPIQGFDATFEIKDQEYYEATFKRAWEQGNATALYAFSAKKDTLYSQLPIDITSTAGGRGLWTTKLIYNYFLDCTEDLWRQAGQTAIGYGVPPGANRSFILVEVQGDSLLILRSWDGKTQLTYTYGAKLPLHNLVTFSVVMTLQMQWGNFDPQAGDQVAVAIQLPAGELTRLLAPSTSPGIWEATYDFPPSLIGSTLAYRFSRLKSATGQWVREAEPRQFTLLAGTQRLPLAYFDNQTNLHPVAQMPVIQDDKMQDSPTVAYDIHLQRWLVVWRETVSGQYSLWGRFVDENGTIGPPFEILNNGPNGIYLPHAEYLANGRRFMVAWDDRRAGNGDIYGILLDPQGNKIPTPRSVAGGEFAICNHDSAQYHPRLAYNKLRGTVLCVWQDYRNSTKDQWGQTVNSDLYGRLLSEDGALLPPAEPSDSRSAMPIAFAPTVDERMPDVTYLGLHTSRIDEWLVVYSRYSLTKGTAEIWGVRVRGANGTRLDTWGRPVRQGVLHKVGAAQAPPWLPEFPISVSQSGGGRVASAPRELMGAYYRGSPHVAANDETYETPQLHTRRHINKLPECMVVWTEYLGYSADIMGQRVSYFPDSTAFRRGFKNQREADSLYTVVLLDEQGKPPADPAAWKTWEDFQICTDPYHQEYNELDYNQQDGTFLAVWNDWRVTLWDGSYPIEPGWQVPQSDIFGQRLRVLPGDTLFTLLDETGDSLASPLVNTPIACTEAYEGMRSYPPPAYGIKQNEFLVAYRYGAAPAQNDIYASLYNGTSTIPQPGSSVAAAGHQNSFALHQNYPNPFNSVTTIEYHVRDACRVILEVVDVRGRTVARFLDQFQQPGAYTVRFDTRELASGIYFYQIRMGEFKAAGKMVLAR